MRHYYARPIGSQSDSRQSFRGSSSVGNYYATWPADDEVHRLQVGGNEQPRVGGSAGKGDERALGFGGVARLFGDDGQPEEYRRSDRIGCGRWRVLDGLGALSE